MNTTDFTRIGSVDAKTAIVDLNMPIPERRKDPVIEFKRFLTTALLQMWQRDNPHYCIFTTEFHPCKEEGYDVAIYVTCGNLKEFNDHNDMVDNLHKMRQEALMAAAEANPDVVTTPPAAIVDNPDVVTEPDPDADLQAPDPKENVVKIKPAKEGKGTPKKNA